MNSQQVSYVQNSYVNSVSAKYSVNSVANDVISEDSVRVSKFTSTAAFIATMALCPATTALGNNNEDGSFSRVSAQYQVSQTRSWQTEAAIKQSESYHETLGELQSYLLLENDWDGYGGGLPDDEVINSCISYLGLLRDNGIFPPKAMISGAGEVGLFWRYGDSHFEVGFEEKGLFSFFVRHNGKIFGADDVDSSIIPEQLLAALLELTEEMV